MLTNAVEVLWLRLHTILATFAERFTSVEPALVHELRRTANNAFLLRGYLAFRRHAGSDELAITIDVQSNGQEVTVESDACSDDGRVVAVGPSATISLSQDTSNIETALSNWLRVFERFLLESESALLTAASQLT